ncbi:hypothetical protein JNUCC83_04305 [Vagococcus sp. JNUCC 83]
MNQMKGMFIAITIVSLFGSLSRWTPNILWKDIFYFFRKDKNEYLAFSNAFRGNYFFISGIVSLLCSILSFFVTIQIDSRYIFLAFFIYVIIAESVLQLTWTNHLKHNKVN